jgi:predicted nucleic acid-binding protein
VSDSRSLVVADTSVVINLNATGCAARILAALPFRMVVTDVVQSELQEDRKSDRQDTALLADLVAASHIRIVSLGAVGQRVFGDLVIGPASETLDDGEAATIAYAEEAKIVPVIDERKARRICAQRFNHLQPLSTVDLLADADVAASLGRDALTDAVFQALQTARMRVLPQYINWVVAMIGADRASQCPSLPRSVRLR